MKKTSFANRLLGYAAKKLSLPDAVIPGTSEIYLCNNRTLYISEHNGILRADNDLVIFRCAEFSLAIYGTDLLIDASTANSAYVCGRFSQICFD